LTTTPAAIAPDVNAISLKITIKSLFEEKSDQGKKLMLHNDIKRVKSAKKLLRKFGTEPTT
jgi:hypothetical protein